MPKNMAFLIGNSFFQEWGSVTFWASLCQKSAKTNKPISRKAGNRWLTNGQRDGQWLIYRTSRLVQKMNLLITKQKGRIKIFFRKFLLSSVGRKNFRTSSFDQLAMIFVYFFAHSISFL